MNESAPRTTRLERFYHEYLLDQNATALLRKVSQHYTPGTLERLLDAQARLTRRAAAMALGHLGDFSSNAALGRALQDADRSVRMLAENALRAVWCRDGNASQQASLREIIRYNAIREFYDAIDAAELLIETAPGMAEAWNQRAIAFYSIGKYHRSIDDCRQAVELNAYHFGAIAGMGQSYLQLGNELWALDAFRRALTLNPNLEGIRANIVRLESRLKRR